jgi:uncharacterized protein YbcI
MRVPNAAVGLRSPAQHESRPASQSLRSRLRCGSRSLPRRTSAAHSPYPGPDRTNRGNPAAPGGVEFQKVAENGEKVEREVQRLTQPDWLNDVESSDRDRYSSVRAEISNAMVGLKKNFYGKGPTKAKTFLNDNYVFCVMEGGLTRNEETLIERGHEDLVRNYRLRFQEAMEGPTVEAVQRITGRSVIGYHSQIVFHPERAFEIFVLDRPIGDSG